MKIIHLSDLHFGTEIPQVVDALLMEIHATQPDLIIISGDLTQRATTNQFKVAQEFIKKLQVKKIICVPGNHDITFYNLIERFLYPFHKYQQYIEKNLQTELKMNNLALLAINSATPFTAMNGYISPSQLREVDKFFSEQPTHFIKIVVMHHNLIHSEQHKIINNAEKVLECFAKANVNLVLSGHLHHSYIEQPNIDGLQQPMYLITAGTATSKRLGQQPNSFNLLLIEDSHIKITVKEYKDSKFEVAFSKEFLIS